MLFLMVDRKSTIFLKILVLLTLFSPYVKVAGRSVYLFDFFLIALVIFSFIFLSFSVRRNDFIYFLFAISFSVLILFFQAVFWGEVPGIYLVRLFFYFSFYIFLKDFVATADKRSVIEFVSRCVAIVSLLGIFQVVDHYAFSGSLGIAKFTSVLYPYPGELAIRSQELSNGLQLKVGSFFNATSSFDGHSILLGDFLSISLGFLLYYRKYFALGLTTLCLILTMSRGAWAMGFLSLVVFSFTGFTRRNVKSSLILASIAVFIFISLISIEVVREYLLFRVNNTLYTFGIIEDQVGRAEDPRTAMVWPRLINTLSELGWGAYLIGAPISFSADSGYLTILRDSGFLGLLIILSFPLYILASKVDRKAMLRVLIVIAVGMIVHPVFQGIRTVLFSVIIFLVFSLPDSTKFNRLS